MPSFEFTDIPTSLALSETTKDGKTVQTGSLSFTVRNKAQRSLVGRLSVKLPPPPPPPIPAAAAPGAAAAMAAVAPAISPAWFAFDGAPPTGPGERELEFAAAATQTQKLLVAVPAGTPGGHHTFNVRIVSAEDDPDNDYADSPAVAFDVPPPKIVQTPSSQKFPWWILIVVAVVLIAGGVGAYFLLSPSKAAVVPTDVINERSDTAASELIGMGFTVSFNYQQNTAAAGTVISSSPPPGKAPGADKKVTLNVSQGTAIGDFPLCKRVPEACRPLHTLSDLRAVKILMAAPK